MNLRLFGLPIGNRLIDSETTIDIKYFRDIVRRDKQAVRAAKTQSEAQQETEVHEADAAEVNGSVPVDA